MSKSIMQTDKQCYLCGREMMLERHHVLGGSANRKCAERWGCWIWLCHDCHLNSGKGAQYNKETNRWLKQQAQMAFEELYGHDKWMNVFMKNYL